MAVLVLWWVDSNITALGALVSLKTLRFVCHARSFSPWVYLNDETYTKRSVSPILKITNCVTYLSHSMSGDKQKVTLWNINQLFIKTRQEIVLCIPQNVYILCIIETYSCLFGITIFCFFFKKSKRASIQVPYSKTGTCLNMLSCLTPTQTLLWLMKIIWTFFSWYFPHGPSATLKKTLQLSKPTPSFLLLDSPHGMCITVFMYRQHYIR